MSKINPKVFLRAAERLARGWENADVFEHSPYCCDNIYCTIPLNCSLEYEAAHFELFGALFDPNGGRQRSRALPGWWPDGDYESRLIALCLAAEIARDREASREFVQEKT